MMPSLGRLRALFGRDTSPTEGQISREIIDPDAPEKLVSASDLPGKIACTACEVHWRGVESNPDDLICFICEQSVRLDHVAE